LAIVGDVSLSHQQISIADPGHATTALGASMDGDKFADLISFTDLRRGRLARVLDVLRTEANRDKWENVRVVADRRPAVNNNMRIEPHTITERYFSSDRTERANMTVVAELRSVVDNRGLMNE